MKKPLTATQRKNRYRSLQYTTFASEFISILTPYIILGSINFNEWFPNVLPWGFGQGVSDAMSVMNQNLVNISNSLQSLSFNDTVYFEKVASSSESFLSITMESPFSPQSGFSCHKEIVIDSNELSSFNTLILINYLGASLPCNVTVLALDAMANRKKLIVKKGSSSYTIPKTDILVDGVTEVHILFDFVY